MSRILVNLLVDAMTPGASFGFSCFEQCGATIFAMACSRPYRGVRGGWDYQCVLCGHVFHSGYHLTERSLWPGPGGPIHGGFYRVTVDRSSYSIGGTRFFVITFGNMYCPRCHEMSWFQLVVSPSGEAYI